jgi:tetratricopeptide (TPR) repeat protein
MPHTGIVYTFREPDVGWSSGGDFAQGSIPLPKPATTRPTPTPQEQFRNAITVLDSRILREPNNFTRYRSKITYLVHQKHQKEAIELAQQVAKKFPEQWWPPMVVAQLSEGEDKAAAVTAFSQWADRNANFNNYWYLAEYYRQNKRPEMALKALEQAAAYPVLSRDCDTKVPDYFYFSAAAYACKMQKYDLSLKICDRWGGNDSLAIRAGAYLGLGRIADAQVFARKAIEQEKEQTGWSGDLEHLDAAAKAGDTTFIYNADREIFGKNWVDLFESWGDDE